MSDLSTSPTRPSARAGAATFSGNRTTVAPSASFEIEIHPANRTGADRIVATARRGGQTCTGTVTI